VQVAARGGDGGVAEGLLDEMDGQSFVYKKEEVRRNDRPRDHYGNPSCFQEIIRANPLVISDPISFFPVST
jgi:hypothetical protein